MHVDTAFRSIVPSLFKLTLKLFGRGNSLIQDVVTIFFCDFLQFPSLEEEIIGVLIQNNNAQAHTLNYHIRATYFPSPTLSER